MKISQNRGTDSLGCPSISLDFGDGTQPTTVRPPAPHTATTERTAWMEGFAAAVKLIREHQEAAATA